MSKSKRHTNNLSNVDRDQYYAIDDAVEILKNYNAAKFNETVDVAVNLGVDPRHADQIVRGTVSLPHGTGKSVKVLVFAQGDNVEIAQEAGADFVGSDEYVEKIKKGWTDVDVIISTPDLMGKVGQLGKVLGPRGLMPNPKAGTVTVDVSKAVNEVKAGRIEYRVEKNGIVHSIIGKVNFEKNQLIDNLKVFINAIIKSRPNSLKGVYMKKITLSSSMGPGIKIDKTSFVI